MSQSALPSPGIALGPAVARNPSRLLLVGGAGLVVALAGFFIQPVAASTSWLIAISFWTALVLGMLFLVQLHHIFDAGWSTVVRRPLEHYLAAVPYLGLLFIPLLLVTWFYDAGAVWKWMNPDKVLPGTGGQTVAEDILWVKKAAYLNQPFFVIRLIFYFAVWAWFAQQLRKTSFSQDLDGSPAHTHRARKISAAGLIVVGLTSTFAAFDWIMSLEYHWFSTIFGVWYFSSAMRLALAAIILTCIYLVKTGHLDGIFQKRHLHDLASILFAFTVFWAYISFSQYFLIWNANIPEVTFWYNLREEANWWPISLFLVFGHFLFPFLFLLFYRNKTSFSRMAFISVWVLLVQFIDFVYHILPTRKLADGSPVPFGLTIWDLSAMVGIGAIVVWAFVRSFPTSKLIPIRDPRIAESLQSHE